MGAILLLPPLLGTPRSSASAEDAATDVEAMTDEELRQAVRMLVQREQERDARIRKQAEDREQRWRDALVQDADQLLWSVEIIKVCVLCVSGLVGVLLLVGIVVGISVHREVTLIREKFRHPLESAGALVGRQLEGRLRKAAEE